MSGSDDRRAEPRLDSPVTIYVEVCAADYGDAAPASIVICNSLDISANGLQVRMDQQVAEGSILRLCAQFTGKRQPLYLVGEVKWVRHDENEYCIGFGLFESESTDIAAWKELIANRLVPGAGGN